MKSVNNNIEANSENNNIVKQFLLEITLFSVNKHFLLPFSSLTRTTQICIPILEDQRELKATGVPY